MSFGKNKCSEKISVNRLEVMQFMEEHGFDRRSISLFSTDKRKLIEGYYLLKRSTSCLISSIKKM